MKKFVFLKVGQGDFDRGFPVTLKIASPDRTSFLEVEIEGELPPQSKIKEIYNTWLQNYNLLSDLPSLAQQCHDLAKALKAQMRIWLSSSSHLKFQRLRETLCKYLDPADEIFVFLQTREEILKKLPWQEWDLFSDRFTQAEIAISPPEIEFVPQGKSRTGQNKVRILSILGDATKIDIEKDKKLIKNLPNADPEFLEEPDRQQFVQKLWEQDWDILFFAGHSASQEKSGVINLNAKDELSLDELKNSLREASDRGLQLAIFNSCDGLKLAEYLAELNIPQIIVMREPVLDQVAQLFLKYFLQAYSGGKTLYLAVRQARSRLEEIATEILGTTWLPIIYQKSLEIPPTWQEIVHGTPPSIFKNSYCITEKYESPEEFPWITGVPLFDKPGEFMENYTAKNTALQGIKLALSTNKKDEFFVTTWDSYVKVWGLERKKLKQRLISDFSFFNKAFSSVAISPDNQIIAACKTYQIFLWKIGNSTPIYTSSKTLLSNFFDFWAFEALAFSPDGTTLVTNDNQDIKLIDIKTKTEIMKLRGHSDKVSCVVFNPKDPRILASCSYDKTIKIWRVDTGESIGTLTGHREAVFTLAFSPDGKILASGSNDNTIQLWSIYSGKSPKTLRQHSEGITCVVFSPDGRTLISSSYDGTIQEWAITGKHLHSIFNAHQRGVTSIALSSDGQTLISGGRDRTIKVWRRSL